nr:hypothetical protein [Pseudoalteromonas tetraodonis]
MCLVVKVVCSGIGIALPISIQGVMCSVSRAIIAVFYIAIGR